MPRMRPFDLAQSYSLPSGMGVESISRTIAVPSRRVFRSSWPATRANVSAKMATGRRRLASDKGRAHQRAAAQVVVVLAVCVPAGFQPPQAGAGAKLGKDQRHQMIPACEAFDVGVAVMALGDRL